MSQPNGGARASESTVSLRGIGKSFGATRALDGVSLDVNRGEVLAMVGANGAGKSTLIKVLSGAYTEYEGVVVIEGREVRFHDPLEAQQQGIQTVHQHVDDGIVPGLSVAENLTLDLLARGDAGIRFSAARARGEAVRIAERLGLRFTKAVLSDDVRRLRVSDRQLLVLARALSRSPRLLILDEPTSALSAAEAERLFEIVRRLVEAGVSVLYVSHRLSEVEALADRIAVLRDGRLRAIFGRPFDRRAVVEAILGEVVAELEHAEQQGEQEVLRLVGVRLDAASPPIDLTVRRGEVTGLTGLIGSGKSELAEALFGVRALAAGRLLLDGRPTRLRHPANAIAAGIYLVPEDRATQALIPEWPVRANLSLPFLKQVGRLGLLHINDERRRAQQIIRALGVVCEGPDADIASLSGGNQQKVAVGRWLWGKPRVLILDEPFRGVDIGARSDISRKVRELAAAAAVIVISSDPDEVIEVADRVLVLAHRRIVLDERISAVDRATIVGSMTRAA